MTGERDCLQEIGSIAVQWSNVEASLRTVFWLYTGMDRPTFDILFSNEAGSKIEDHLKRLVKFSGPNPGASQDILRLLEQAKIHRQNRNTVLHKMRASELTQLEKLQPQIGKVREQTEAFERCLAECTKNLSRFISQRSAIETPDGLDDWPDADISIPVYVFHPG